MGIDWWAHDPQLSSDARRQERKLDAERENKTLRERVADLPQVGQRHPTLDGGR